jgi:uncharacterized membrane protein YfcA
MNLKNWLGQSTTGAGIATLLGALAAIASGSITWQQALPIAIGGVIGVIWPESTTPKIQAQQAAGATPRPPSVG